MSKVNRLQDKEVLASGQSRSSFRVALSNLIISLFHFVPPGINSLFITHSFKLHSLTQSEQLNLDGCEMV